MTRQRLRPAHEKQTLSAMYATPHNHAAWPEHVERVKQTVAFAKKWLGGPVDVAADLSCGSGAILAGLDAGTKLFGDWAFGWQYEGPIEQTIHDIPDVDLLVHCETLEHVDDPDTVLRLIRGKARALLLSTPVGAWGDVNPEHYWAWSREDVEYMLTAAGFTVDAYEELDIDTVYRWGVWGCR